MTFETHAITSILRTLHRMYRQLSDLKGQLERGPRVIQAHQAEVAKRENDLETIRKEALDLKIATDEKQLLLGTKEASVEKRQTQLLQTNDNKEYQALIEEIAAAKMSNSVLEDEILEAMERAEEVAERINQADGDRIETEKELEAARQRFSKKAPLLQAEIDRIQAEITETDVELAHDVRELYLRSVRSRGEQALAEINGAFCSGCNQRIPVNMINLLMLGTPAICKSCGRLLYLAENNESTDSD